jgi:hypothetical protein
MKRTLASFIALVALVVLAAAAGLPSMIGRAASLPTRIAGYGVPTDLDDGHFLLGPTTVASALTDDAAISMALSYAGSLATAPSGISVQRVSFTDTHRGVEAPDRSFALSFVDVPAYLVRFTGVPQPVFGGLASSPGPAAQELNVVIDARTGQYVEMFSYQ